MAAICSVACGARPAVPVSFHDNCTDIFRKFGSNHFILIKCDYVFTDVTDPAEWTTAIAADNIHISPAGALVLNEPDNPVVQVEGCGREVVGVNTYTIDFRTYQTGVITDNVPQDVKYWRDLVANVGSYRLLMLDCSEIFTVDDGWMDAVEAAGGGAVALAGQNPGFEFSVSSIPIFVEGDESLGVWTTQFTVKKTGILEAVQLPGVPAVLA